jgi:hypothetical protein
MNHLSRVFIFKIAATVAFWCIPLLLFPSESLEALGLPPESSYMFVSMLGWAYLALCVGYAFGLNASRRGGAPLARSGSASSATAAITIGLYLFGVHGSAAAQQVAADRRP